MRRHGLLALGASVCLVISSLFAAEGPKLDGPKLDGVKCLINGDDDVDPKISLNFNGGKIYFCCEECQKSFKDEKDKVKKEKYAAKANQQLLTSGQAKQVKCPLEGKAHKDTITAEVAGSKVAFCCEMCRDKVAKAKDAEQVELVFGTKPFAKGFVVSSKDKTDKTARARSKEPREITEKEIEKLIQVQERQTEKLLQIKGVTGTAIGASDNGDPVIKVLVETQEAARDVPANLEGVPVEVVVTGPIKPLWASTPKAAAKVDRTSRFARPVPIGVSTGNAGECSAGTIGCRVKKNGNVYVLSNNHVLARQNNAPKDSPVMQPGLYDTRCTVSGNNQIGTLAEFKQIFFGGVDNTMDAALGQTTSANLGTATPSDGYGAPKSTVVANAINQKVQKYGRTTGLTKGRVMAMNAIVNVGYTGGTARFINQVVVTPNTGAGFIKAGDSGSLLVTDPGRNPTCLLFAGNSNGTIAIGSPIGKILTEFGITIDGE